MRRLLPILLLLLLPLTAEAGSLTWPGYDKWSWQDYGCWLPTDPTGQWHVVITYPSASGAPAWDWNVVQLRANNGSWAATFLFHWKECLWAYAPDLAGYWQLRPSLPGLPGEGWLHGLVLSHPSADGVWYVASTPDGSQSFRWAPTLGKVREILPVSTPGVVTDPQPWTPRPGDTTYEWHGPDAQYVRTPSGGLYLDLPYDGQRFLTQDVPSDVIPFSPSLGTARAQADFAMNGMTSALEKTLLKVSEMDAFVTVTLAANPNWPTECGGNASCQRDLQREKLRSYIAAAEVELDKLELHYSMLKGVMAHDGAFIRYFSSAESAAFLTRQAILDMGMMYRFVFPRHQRAEPDIRQQQIMLASLPEPIAPIPPTPAEPAPPSPPPPGPALTPDQEYQLRVVANYYDYGRSMGWSDAQICTIVCPVLNGPVLSPVLRDPAYVGTISTTLRGYHPDIVSDYTGMINYLNGSIGNFPASNGTNRLMYID